MKVQGKMQYDIILYNSYLQSNVKIPIMESLLYFQRPHQISHPFNYPPQLTHYNAHQAHTGAYGMIAEWVPLEIPPQSII